MQNAYISRIKLAVFMKMEAYMLAGSYSIQLMMMREVGAEFECRDREFTGGSIEPVAKLSFGAAP
jgi:hypothetical protein